MSLKISFGATLLGFAALGVLAAETPGPGPDPEARDAERAAGMAAAGIAYAGTWYTTEVIVFERSRVDAASYGEGLLVDRDRGYPARLRSLEPAGAEGSVYYSDDPDDAECRRADPRSATGSGATPVAFSRPASRASVAETDSVATDASPTDADTPVSSAMPTADAPPVLQPPDPLDELRAAVASYEETLPAQSLVWLPREAHTLGPQARRLASNGYRVLLHEAWIQNLARRRSDPAILVQTGRQEAGLAELEGVLRLARNRGTRLDAELWYRPPVDAATSSTGYVELRESRRLGDGELHYLDHPKLGVLVHTAPMPLPPEVIQAFEALNPPAAESTEAGAPSAPLPTR